MAATNAIVTRGFDLFFAPFARATPWLGLAAVSLVSGIVLLLVFRYTSNQRAIRATKDRIVAHLLEVVLYRDELRVVLRAQVGVIRDSVRYLGHTTLPLVCLALPVGLLLVQIDLRYGHRPLRVGEPAVVAVRLRPGGGSLDSVSVWAPQGLQVQTAGLRIPAEREVDWRIVGAAPGAYDLNVVAGGHTITKRVVIGPGRRRVSVARVQDGWRRQFLHPGEPPLPHPGPIESVRISYPSASLPLLNWRVHWVWPWLLLSMAFGYALRGPLRVQV